jgi:hypothetical protein
MTARLFGAMLLFLGSCAFAQQSSNFSVTIGTAVLCLDDIEPGYFFNYLRKTKPPVRHEQGAYWFSTQESFFGIPLKEVFLSDGSSEYTFVGLVTSLTPQQLVDALSESAPAGGRFRKREPENKYSVFVSPAGSVIAFQGKFAKIFCRRDKVRRAE